MVKALHEVQKQMWESWFSLMRAAPSGIPVSPGMADQWRELATRTLKGWTADAEQVAKDVSQRLVTTQDCVLRFLELALSTWNAVAPKIEAGEDWHTVLSKYTEQFGQQFALSPQGIGKAT